MGVHTIRPKPHEREAFLLSGYDQLPELIEWSRGAARRTLLRGDDGEPYEGMPGLVTMHGHVVLKDLPVWIVNSGHDFYPLAPAVMNELYVRVGS